MDLGLEIVKTNVGIRISSIPCVPIFRQNEELWLFRPNLPKNEFSGRNLKNICPDSESAPPKYQVYQFPIKMDNFFGLNLGKLSNYVRYFGSNNVESVAESWVEAEMSWVEMNRAGWRLQWARRRYVGLGGGGWSWVEVGVRLSNTLLWYSFSKIYTDV